jgi:hypothetical protein
MMRDDEFAPARTTRWTMYLIALPLLALAAGCGFEGRWAEAGKMPTPETGIDGRWQGKWDSTASGHTDGLRCIITRAGATDYRAEFKATYGWFFSFSYTMTMHASATDGTTRPDAIYFGGEADLGWLAGGRYTYDGRATTTEFFCNYASSADRGTFQMTRPGGTPATRGE